MMCSTSLIKSIVYLIAALAIGTLVQDTNSQSSYCSRSLCGARKHIACGNSGKFAASCPSNARLINLRPLRSAILQSHNKYRNTVAGGGIAKLQQASRMATMRWNDELARLAALNVRQCRMQHDKCRNTPTFHFSGQNLAMSWRTGNRAVTIRSTVTQMIKSFYDEYRDVSMNIIRSYQSTTGKDYGHFTAMMNDKNTHVGCAAASAKRGQRRYVYFACNYARTNIIGRPVYTAGSSASRCSTGRNPNYRNLCSINEKFNVNVP